MPESYMEHTAARSIRTVLDETGEELLVLQVLVVLLEVLLGRGHHLESDELGCELGLPIQDGCTTSSPCSLASRIER